MFEYMTIEFYEIGAIVDTSQMLETILDSKGKMGWRLHTVDTIQLDRQMYHAVLIFERKFRS